MQGHLPDTLKILLKEKASLYNTPAFIENDPIQVPHLFTERENIEISGFFAATFAWGRRDIIIRNTLDLIRRMENRPYEFLMNMDAGDLETFRDFKHRTINGEDCIFFLRSLQRMYRDGPGLYQAFLDGYLESRSIKDAIINFRKEFLITGHNYRSRKHIADPSKGSAAKRINLFLRWMVRKDEAGVDLGIWDEIDPAHLYLPLDVHTGNVARQIGILQRKQNDWKAVEELTAVLRELDPADPVKYDFALFGLGVSENM
ncbi:TIGR02757 family protein [Bacteroidota bacterium]